MADANNEGLNVLYIEDDIDVQTMIKFYFKRMPHHLECVTNGEAALQQLQQQSHDLILLDWTLPNQPSGQELINRIRAMDGYNNTPIVVVSGYSDSDELAELQKDSIHDFLSKPLDKEVLKQMLNSVAEKR